MKSKLNLMLILSIFILSISGGGICFAEPKDQIEKPVKDLRSYASSIIPIDANKSISQKFGITDWIFYPKKVCEVNGTDLTLEGDLFKDNKVQKKIRINLVKEGNSEYKVVRVSEISASNNAN